MSKFLLLKFIIELRVWVSAYIYLEDGTLLQEELIKNVYAIASTKCLLYETKSFRIIPLKLFLLGADIFGCCLLNGQF